jgi:hypothetical protein
MSKAVDLGRLVQMHHLPTDQADVIQKERCTTVNWDWKASKM